MTLRALDPAFPLERQLAAMNQASVHIRDAKPRRSFARDEAGDGLAHADVSEAPRTTFDHGSSPSLRFPISREITTSSRVRP